MVSPQKEHGYTPIANEILEAVARLRVNATQLRIILVVWRYTYGFNRKEHELSEGFISKATGIHKKQIGRELAELIQNNVLTEVEPPTFSSPRVLAFNKDYDSWQGSDLLTGIGSVAQTGIGSVDTPGIGSVDQERQYLKTNEKGSGFVFSTDCEPFKAALYLKNKITDIHPRQPLPPMESDPEDKHVQSWARTMDLLHRKGPPGGKKGYSWQEIKRLIDLAMDDPFWQNNILSAEKFRAQIVRLEAKARQTGKVDQRRQTAAPAPEHRRLGGVDSETHTAAQR